MIGIISNLIIFPPSFLLVQLFRRTRRRKSRIDELRKHVDNVLSQNSKK